MEVLTLFELYYYPIFKRNTRFKSTLSTELFCRWTEEKPVPNLPNFYV